MKNQNVCFVIVTYKPNAEVLRRLVAAVSEYRVIAIDNTEKNIGYGAGANQGMKQAFDAGVEWVVVCNQDVTLTKKGVSKFVATLEKMTSGIAGPEAGALDPKRWTTVLASRHIRPAQCKPGLERGGDGLLYISGSVIAIHKKVWETTGGFFGPYFIYYEDVDLCVRAKKAGFSLRQVEIGGFRHESDESHVSDENNEKRKQKEYYLARNHLLFVRRLAPIIVKCYELVRLPKSIAEHSATGNTEAIRGVSDFAVGRFGKRI